MSETIAYPSSHPPVDGSRQTGVSGPLMPFLSDPEYRPISIDQNRALLAAILRPMQRGVPKHRHAGPRTG